MRYLDSQFMGYTSANDLQNRLFDALEGLHHGSIVQIAMDGPNVNWHLYTDMSVVVSRYNGFALVRWASHC